MIIHQHHCLWSTGDCLSIGWRLLTLKHVSVGFSAVFNWRPNEGTVSRGVSRVKRTHSETLLPPPSTLEREPIKKGLVAPEAVDHIDERSYF